MRIIPALKQRSGGDSDTAAGDFCQNLSVASSARGDPYPARRWRGVFARQVVPDNGQSTIGIGAIPPGPVGEKVGIRVFLADDHRLLVAGFRDVLKDYGIDVVEVAYSLDGLIDRYMEVKPDVLVIDVRFDTRNAGENGLDACEELLARYHAAKIIVFSQFDDQYIIEKSYKLGVLAFVRKDESTEVLHEAIKTVAEGKEYFSPEIAQLLAWSAVKNRNPNKLLDEKEMRAFAMTADGASLIEIAAEMGLSTKTVGTLMKSVKTKLSVENPADITKLAIRYGVTTTDPKTRS